MRWQVHHKSHILLHQQHHMPPSPMAQQGCKLLLLHMPQPRGRRAAADRVDDTRGDLDDALLADDRLPASGRSGRGQRARSGAPFATISLHRIDRASMLKSRRLARRCARSRRFPARSCPAHLTCWKVRAMPSSRLPRRRVMMFRRARRSCPDEEHAGDTLRSSLAAALGH